MKVFPTFRDGAPALGILVDHDSAAVVGARQGNGSPVIAMLRGGAQTQLELAARAGVLAGQGDLVAMAELSVGPLIPDRVKILCVGFNYRQHASEMAVDPPAMPNIFCKFHNSVVGPGGPILLPRASRQVDYEGEVAVVIGRRCFDVAETDALSYVAGYTIMNDVTARDLQFQTSQWTLGKAVDTFAPLGPVLLTADEVPDPQDLQITTRLNGGVVQDASTADMIFGVARIISAISRSMTLECGDIIATGTPEGVGYKRNPPRFLADGDVVEVDVSGIGTLSNPVRSIHRRHD